MTRKFLLHLVLSFYEKLNLRALRRGLVEYYTANTLAFSADGKGIRALEYMASIPCCGALRVVLLRALDNFLKLKALGTISGSLLHFFVLI